MKGVITPDQVNQMLVEGKSLSIVDVREHEEVAYGMIPGAKHIPLGQLQNRLSELNKDAEYIFVCRSGNRSGMACDFLNSIGYKATNMVGGMMSWAGDVE